MNPTPVATAVDFVFFLFKNFFQHAKILCVKMSVTASIWRSAPIFAHVISTVPMVVHAPRLTNSEIPTARILYPNQTQNVSKTLTTSHFGNNAEINAQTQPIFVFKNVMVIKIANKSVGLMISNVYHIARVMITAQTGVPAQTGAMMKIFHYRKNVTSFGENKV